MIDRMATYTSWVGAFDDHISRQVGDFAAKLAATPRWVNWSGSSMSLWHPQSRRSVGTRTEAL